MTRQDAAIGDNRNFQDDLFDLVCLPTRLPVASLIYNHRQLLLNVGQFGDDSPETGNRSIVNVKAMSAFKLARFVADQKANPKVCVIIPSPW